MRLFGMAYVDYLLLFFLALHRPLKLERDASCGASWAYGASTMTSSFIKTSDDTFILCNSSIAEKKHLNVCHDITNSEHFIRICINL